MLTPRPSRDLGVHPWLELNSALFSYLLTLTGAWLFVVTFKKIKKFGSVYFTSAPLDKWEEDSVNLILHYGSILNPTRIGIQSNNWEGGFGASYTTSQICTPSQGFPQVVSLPEPNGF